MLVSAFVLMASDISEAIRLDRRVSNGTTLRGGVASILFREETDKGNDVCSK